MFCSPVIDEHVRFERGHIVDTFWLHFVIHSRMIKPQRKTLNGKQCLALVYLRICHNDYWLTVVVAHTHELVDDLWHIDHNF
jgi:hypothetical protein